MRFGVFDQLEQPGGLPLAQLYTEHIELVVRAEAAGFWGYHKSEHHMIPLDAAPSINVFLAALSQRTSTIRLGSLVHLMPFYHPLRLVEELCMLDHLSEGRLEIGFGRGISLPEHVLWGNDAEESAARNDEVIDLVIAAMRSQGDFSYEGRFFRFDDVPMEVEPYQRPHPPLWRPGNLDRAAELGVSTIVAGPTSVVVRSIERYRENLRTDGIGRHHEPTIAALRKFHIAPTDAEADERARAAWAAYTHNLTVLFRRFDVPPPNDPTFGGDYDRAKEVQAVVVGSPERVRAHVEELAATKATDYLIGCFSWGDLTADEYLRSLDLFGEHIIGG